MVVLTFYLHIRLKLESLVFAIDLGNASYPNESLNRKPKLKPSSYRRKSHNL